MLKTKIKNKVKSEEGQAMVEFALALPLLLMILCGIIDFGWLFYNQLNVDNAAREAARAVCVDCATIPYDDVVDEATEIVKSNIYNPATLPELDGVNVVYMDNSGQEMENSMGTSAKMVRVDVKINMPVLTFVLHSLCNGDVRAVTSSTTFKIEKGTTQEITEP